MSLAFSPLDLLVVLVVLGSMGYAIWRGFVAESLAIIAWAGAAFAALYLGPWVARLAHSLIATPWIATLSGYVVVFIGVFIPLQFASYRFSEGVKRSAVGPLDRVLGATFGIVRGLALLGLAYIVFDAMVPIRSQPQWVVTARTLPLVQSSAQVLLALVPGSDRAALRDAPPPVVVSPPDAHREVRHSEPPAKPVKHRHTKKGYGAKDRRALDRLFEATGNNGGGNR
jgi:membrane protein required for colicin V production